MNTNTSSHPDWHKTLTDRLPLMGHRNWVVVVDSAYPEQTAPGITTLLTGEDHYDVIRKTLVAIEACPHVRPDVMLDRELGVLADEALPEFAHAAAHIRSALGNRQPQALLHGDIIAELDEAGKTFTVLVLKTTSTLAYSSVFFRLMCGYWSDDQESALRAKIGKPQ